MFFGDYTELHLDTELVAQVILDFERSVWSVQATNIKTSFFNLANPLALDEEMQAELWSSFGEGTLVSLVCSGPNVIPTLLLLR